jgi:hypothetical protein
MADFLFLQRQSRIGSRYSRYRMRQQNRLRRPRSPSTKLTCQCPRTGCRGGRGSRNACTSGWTAATLKFAEGEVSEEVGGCGWSSGYRLRAWSTTKRGCSTRCWARAPEGRRRAPRTWAGARAAAVSGVEQGVTGGPRRPARAGRRRAGEGRARVADGRVSLGAWADNHHDAGCRVGAAGGGLSGNERDRSATC